MESSNSTNAMDLAGDFNGGLVCAGECIGHRKDSQTLSETQDCLPK